MANSILVLLHIQEFLKDESASYRAAPTEFLGYPNNSNSIVSAWKCARNGQLFSEIGSE